MLIVIAALAAVLVLVFLAANYFFSFALDSKSARGTPAEEITEEKREEWARLAVGARKVSAQGKDGTALNALLFSPKDAFGDGSQAFPHRYAISVHGYKSFPESMARLVSHYLEAGWNVLAIEQRAHGESNARYIGMGYFEKGDILSWASVIEGIDPEAEILLHGISMGAATVMLAAGESGLPASVLAIVEDCGYSTLLEEFAAQLRQAFSLPRFPLIPAASVVCKVRAGFFFSDVDCISAVARSKTPILFIHGENDALVPFSMFDALYEAASCEKQRLSVPGAAHAESEEADPELYWGTVDSFAARYFSSR